MHASRRRSCAFVRVFDTSTKLKLQSPSITGIGKTHEFQEGGRLPLLMTLDDKPSLCVVRAQKRRITKAIGAEKAPRVVLSGRPSLQLSIDFNFGSLQTPFTPSTNQKP